MATSKVGLTTNAITGILPTANGGTGNTSGAAITATANGADNRVATYSSATALNGEANLTFDGSTLTVKPGSNVHQLKLEQNNATDYWSLHADSSGGPLSFNRFTGGAETERMNISSTGDVTIGSSAKISNNGAIANFSNHNGSATETALSSSDGNEKVRCFNDGKITIETNGSERMRILSGGEVIINNNDTIFGGNILQILGKNDAEVVAIQVATNGKKAIQFANASGVEAGSIVTSSSSTAFNTSSDYRLKENETPITDGITRLKTLKPYRFNFKTDPDKTVDGFFAHEVSNVIPEAITGTKDAMHPEVLYADKVLYTAEDDLPEGMNIGDIKTSADELPEGKNFGDVKEATKINPQGIDQSKLVPLLTKALQEAITKIETLETKVTALENA